MTQEQRARRALRRGKPIPEAVAAGVRNNGQSLADRIEAVVTEHHEASRDLYRGLTDASIDQFPGVLNEARHQHQSMFREMLQQVKAVVKDEEKQQRLAIAVASQPPAPQPAPTSQAAKPKKPKRPKPTYPCLHRGPSLSKSDKVSLHICGRTDAYRCNHPEIAGSTWFPQYSCTISQPTSNDIMRVCRTCELRPEADG